MKTFQFLLLLLPVFFFYNCEKNGTNEPNQNNENNTNNVTQDSTIIVGDTTLNSLYYFDFNPDFILNPPQYGYSTCKIDIDQDGVNDLSVEFKFEYGHFDTSYDLIIIAENGFSILSDSNQCSIPKIKGDTITNNGLFTEGGIRLLSDGSSTDPYVDENGNVTWINHSNSTGLWKMNEENYVVFKNNENKLGWIRIELESDISTIIKDYAIQE